MKLGNAVNTDLLSEIKFTADIHPDDPECLSQKLGFHIQ